MKAVQKQTWKEPQPMGANEQVLQKRSSGKLRNHWSPDSSDVEDAKGFGEDDVLVKTINFDERDVVNQYFHLRRKGKSFENLGFSGLVCLLDSPK